MNLADAEIAGNSVTFADFELTQYQTISAGTDVELSIAHTRFHFFDPSAGVVPRS